MKRFLCALLCLVLCFGLIPAAAFAAEDEVVSEIVETVEEPAPVCTVSVTAERTELTVGEELQLAANVENAAEETVLVWASSDEEVLTVSENGLVTAIAEGEAVVTVTAGEASAEITLTVAAVPVEDAEPAEEPELVADVKPAEESDNVADAEPVEDVASADEVEYEKAPIEELAGLSYAAKTYTITYKNIISGDMNPNTTKVDEGRTLNLSNASRNNYHFIGWYTNSSCADKYKVTSIVVTKNLTLYAKWQIFATTYTFESTGYTGTTKNVVVNYGKTGKLPSCGFKYTGYAFDSWNVNGENLKAGKPIPYAGDKTITVKANWNVINYTIKYSGINKTDKFNGNQPLNYAVNNLPKIPTVQNRVGYYFDGWYFDSKCKTPANFTSTTTGNKTVYAKWTPYHITYVLKPGAGNTVGTMDSVVINYGKTGKLPVCKFQRLGGWKFAGWEIPGGTVPAGYNLGKYTVSDQNQSAEAVATWAPATYTVTLKNVKPAEVGGSVSVKYNGAQTAYTFPTPSSRTGYTFGGWYLDSKFTNRVFNTNSINGNVSVYAKWDIQKLTVNFNLGKAGSTTVPGTMASKTINYNATLKIPSPSVKAPNGYKFSQWQVGQLLVPAGYSFKNDGKFVGYSGAITLTAEWVAIPYSITYKNVSSTDTIKNSTNKASEVLKRYPYKSYTIEDTIGLPSLARQGYVFNGWFFDSSFKKPAAVIAGRTGNLTLYAKWTKSK